MARNIGATLSLNNGNFFVNMRSAISASNSLKNSLNGTGKATTTFGDKLKSISGIAGSVAKGISIAGVVAATAVGAMVTKSVNSFAEYEQLIGGVETLFKGSADTVKGYADEAYKNAGLSANEYMSTVTSFSASLINSMGGDTATAAARANMAIEDMSDNANKMGTNMDSVMQTYQSISRGNYAMLDNLKLGYGGTKTEMERLITDAERMRAEMGQPIDYDISSFSDVVSAIHDIQTSMGITGTTSKEAATTITGSLNMLKASWNNTLTALTVGGDIFDTSINNLVTSALTFGKNVLPAIEKALGGVGNLVTGLAPIIAAELPNMVSTVLPSLVSAAGSLVSGVSSQIPAIAGALISSVPAVFDGLSGILGESGVTQIKSAFENLKNSISSVFSGIDTSTISNLAGSILPTLSGALAFATNTASGLITVVSTLSPVIAGVTGAVIVYKAAVTAMNVIEGIRNGLIAFSAVMTGTQAAAFAPLTTATIVQIAATSALNVVTSAFGAIMTFVTSPIGLVVIAIGAVIAIGVLLYKHWDTVKAWAGNLWNGIKNIFNGIKNTISNMWNGVKNTASNVWNGIKGIVSDKLNNIKSAYDEHGGGLKDAAAAVMTGVKEYYTIGYDAINKLTGGKLGQVVDNVKGKLAPMVGAVKEKLSGVKDTFSNGFKNAVDFVKTSYNEGALKPVVDKMISAFNNVKTAISNKFNGIKESVGSKLQDIGSVAVNIKDSIAEKFSDVKSAIVEKFTSIKTMVASVLAPMKDAVASIITGIKTVISIIIDGIKTHITNTANIIKTTVMNIVNGIKQNFTQFVTSIQTVFVNIKTAVMTVFEGIKTAFSGVIQVIVGIFTLNTETIKNGVQSIKDGIAMAFEGAKQIVLNVWIAITSSASLVWNNIKTLVSGVIMGVRMQIQNIQSTVAGVFSSVWSTISSTFENVKSKVVTTFENIKTTIKNAIEKVKSFFKFEWSLPKLKLPHFTISGSFSLNPPSVPSLGIEWYAKGGIMKRPTIFGMNGFNAMVGGERGAEAVLPLDMLWSKLAQILSPQSTTAKPSVNNYVYVTVNSGNADDDTIANTVARKIVEAIENM